MDSAEVAARRMDNCELVMAIKHFELLPVGKSGSNRRFLGCLRGEFWRRRRSGEADESWELRLLLPASAYHQDAEQRQDGRGTHSVAAHPAAGTSIDMNGDSTVTNDGVEGNGPSVAV